VCKDNLMEVQALPPIIDMEIHEIDKQKMESLKALADVNMEINKAKEGLLKIEQQKDSYFAERAEELSKELATLLEDSQGILNETHSNYDKIREFCSQIQNFSESVYKLVDDLEEAQSLFTEREKEFRKTLKIEQDCISAIKRDLKTKEIHLENERVGLISREKQLVKQETKAKDLLEELKRGITRLKEGRI